MTRGQYFSGGDGENVRREVPQSSRGVGQVDLERAVGRLHRGIDIATDDSHSFKLAYLILASIP